MSFSGAVSAYGQVESDDRIVLRLMGDSTMADKDISCGNPERGWGQRLKSHVDTCVSVVNYAMNGCSTKSFCTRGLWDRVRTDLEEGDYLFIQFGHNDAKEDSPERYAPAFGLYMDNLRMFVAYALSVGARPVLFTPVARRWFDSDGRLDTGCHGDYPEAAAMVAEEFGIPLIDANRITGEWLASTGDEASRKYYMWVDRCTCPKYPEGKVDNTHTNVAGARRIVELLLPYITAAVPELQGHVLDYDFVVAKDGSGDFLSVQEAVDAAPDYCRNSGVSIYVRNGVYHEKVTVPANRQRLRLVGESLEGTVITYDDYAMRPDFTGRPMGTSATPTFFVYGDDFLAENITFENSSGEGRNIGQACAIMVDADRAAFIGCRFSANQDTIYTYGKGQRQYFRNCLIEGTTDFIFGASTVLFEDCDIVSRKDSYVTAASTPEHAAFGYVFLNCRFLHAEGVGKVYLGRPWRPFARTVLIGCWLDGHIRPEGWHNWDKSYAEKTVFYAEYGSMGPGAADRRERVSWSRTLTARQAAAYVPEIVLDAGHETDKNGNEVRVEWFYKVF